MQNRIHKVVVISILILSLSASYVYAINAGGGPSRALLADPTPAGPPAGAGAPAAAGGGGGPSETTPPSIHIASPGAGWSLTGTIDVIAGATDNVGVARVDFYIDGTLVGSDSSEPYTYSWNTTATANGTRTVSVAAYDDAGNVASAAEFVTVANGTAVLGAVVQPSAAVTVYRVHIGAFKHLRQAERRIAWLKRKGFSGEVITQGGRRPYLVQVGLFEDLQSARDLARRLGRRGFRYRGILEVLR